jgi:signal transduction histidine kinase/CHASE3 domain sensor protein
MTGPRKTPFSRPLSGLRSLSFRRKVAIGFVSAALLVLLVTVTSAAALKIALKSHRNADRQAEELIEVGVLRSALEHRVASFRGYLLTGERDQLDRLRQARSEVVLSVRRLGRSATGAEAALLEAVERADQGYEDAATAGVELRQGGATTQELGRYIERATSARRNVLDRTLAAYVAQKRQLLREAEQRVSRQNLWGSVVILSSGGAALLLLLGLWAPIGRTLASLYETERRERARAEAAERRSAFLAKAGTVLASSLDYPATLATVARLAVPEMGDWCVVDVADAEGRLQRLAIQHADPSKVAAVRRLSELYPEERDQPYGPGKVFRTGRAEVASDITDEMLRSFARDEVHYGILRDLRFKSYISVPLAVRGRTLGVMTFASAESEVHYREEDVEFARDLAHRASLAIDNARLYHEAREAVAARDDFLSIASHELKTPVTTLQLQVQSLLRRASAESSAPPAGSAFDRLAAADRQVVRLTKLINDLLDISRITGRGLELELAPVDLAAVVRDVIARHEEELTRARCAISVKADSPSAGVWDPMRIEQIVTNLLSNAIKYGAGRPIEVLVQGDEAVARLTVRDHGIGIAPEHQARIFQRFERAVSKANYGGFGLGLWIVRQIVDAHGGVIRVESQPEHGSTFCVELPRSVADSPREASPPARRA